MNETLIRLEDWCRILGIKTHRVGDYIKVFKGDSLDVDDKDVQEVFQNAVGSNIFVKTQWEGWYIVGATEFKKQLYYINSPFPHGDKLIRATNQQDLLSEVCKHLDCNAHELPNQPYELFKMERVKL
jgi:hypothetical protein